MADSRTIDLATADSSTRPLNDSPTRRLVDSSTPRLTAMLLITGGMGFIGLHTARCFLDAGQDVVLTHFKTRREPDFIRDELGKRAPVESLDVADASALADLMRKYPIDGIVHLAVPGLGALSPADEY